MKTTIDAVMEIINHAEQVRNSNQSLKILLKAFKILDLNKTEALRCLTRFEYVSAGGKFYSEEQAKIFESY